MTPSTGQSGSTLRDAMDLILLSGDCFRAPPLTLLGDHPLFGGQVAAQALAAASRTVPPDRIAQSVHSYFLQPARPREPVDLRVRRDRDGRRYAWRSVTALQDCGPVLEMSCLFARSKTGADFQAASMPSVPSPAEMDSHPLETIGAGLETTPPDASRLLDLEARFFEDPEPWIGGPPRLWLRIHEPLPDEHIAHACGVIFLSDMSNGLATVPQAGPESRLITLDHTVWLHRPCRADDWLLMDLQPHTTSGGRGFYTGKMFDQQGAHVATLAQDCLFDTPPAGPQTAIA